MTYQLVVRLALRWTCITHSLHQIYPKLPWNSFLISFAAVLPTKVGFIVDGTTTANFELVKRFIFNVGRMFQLEGSEFNIVQFGRNPTKVVIDSKQVSEVENHEWGHLLWYNLRLLSPRSQTWWKPCQVNAGKNFLCLSRLLGNVVNACMQESQFFTSGCPVSYIQENVFQPGQQVSYIYPLKNPPFF